LVNVLVDAVFQVVVCYFYEFEEGMVANMQEAGAIVSFFVTTLDG
jgi:hypothetical protein